jgi:hypothetical protein
VLGCSQSPSTTTISIPDATQTNALTLVSPQRRDFVSGLTLHVQGYLDGTGYVYAVDWPTQSLSGAIDWKIYHDYFQTSCTVYYHPVAVQGGRLSVRYEFH